MLVDQAIITVRSGKGGDGCVSFRREKYIAKGGPKGGDGGRGGDVILKAVSDVVTLLDLSGKHHWFAKSGRPGGPKQMHGADAEDLVIPVAPGTMVYDHKTGQLLGDLDAVGKELIVARGGRGGFGNEHFKSPTHQTPRTATPGEPFEERLLRLELKLIADVGLVGLPNAGKSTLLSVISRATPKIADYPFTTLTPNLGIAELPANGRYARRLIFADIPGLIRGAGQGQGLGHAFLRHIERTRLLVHLLEGQPEDASDPVENYKTIRRELENYSSTLAAKPQMVVLSKLDLLVEENDRADLMARLARETGQDILGISAATRQGVGALLDTCWQQVRKHGDLNEDESPIASETPS